MIGVNAKDILTANKSSDKSKESKGYEYVVLQSHPLTDPLIFVLQTFSYNHAHETMNIENLSNDSKNFVLRIIEKEKLYKINYGQRKGDLALEQNWKIAEEYKTIARRDTNDSEILRCRGCYYPYFTTVASESSIRGLYPATMPVTCLAEDFGREITHCPNCDRELFENDYIDLKEPIPETCLGCKNYFGKTIGGNRIVCGIHPYGWSKNNNCPDYTF